MKIDRHKNQCPPRRARAGIETMLSRYRGGSVVREGRLARIVFRAQAGRTYRRYHSQELLEGHLEIKKPALAKDPSVVVQDLVRDHHRQARQR
jgi:hypothetical protein